MRNLVHTRFRRLHFASSPEMVLQDLYVALLFAILTAHRCIQVWVQANEGRKLQENASVATRGHKGNSSKRRLQSKNRHLATETYFFLGIFAVNAPILQAW
jgi:hypothetical protein